MSTRLLTVWLVAGLVLAGGTARGVPSLVEQVRPGVTVVRDDHGHWSGDLSMGITHQSRAGYEARKVLDLSRVPDSVWRRLRQVRLSVFLTVRDYSPHQGPAINGLDEAIEIVVNGRVHSYPTNCGVPVYQETGAPAFDWYEFPIPKEELSRGVNEIVLRKAPSTKNDDYLYLGIDDSVRRGNSAVRFDGGEWTQERLTVPGSNGEYLVRLYLLTEEPVVRVRWEPGRPGRLQDPARLIAYVGSRTGMPDRGGLRLQAGAEARMEWHPLALDRLEPARARAEGTGRLRLTWLNERGKPLPSGASSSALETSLPGGRTERVSGLVVTAEGGPALLRSLALEAGLGCRPVPRVADMCPPINAPRGRAAARGPSCRLGHGQAVLANAGLRCRFAVGDRLRLISLYNELTASDMIQDPGAVWLFLVEVEGRRYAGARDFRCQRIRPQGQRGFVAELLLPKPRLRAELRAEMTREGLRLALSLANAGSAPVHFKLAFPHLAGLTASAKPAADYYFFPWGGGIFSDTPAIIRRGYGDHEALYQVMDLYSPLRGGGLYIRADDREGWHKTLALRKHVPGRNEEDGQRTLVETAEEYKWTNPLAAVPGTGFAFEYLRRTRPPGGAFAPAPAVLSAHAGDWHTTMRAYADWAHRVWRFRPYPSRLKRVHNMIAVGWANDILFRDGRYRTDFITPMTDCIELMSWWEWSPLGPWRTPFEKLPEVIGEPAYRQWLPYFVKDPVTGQTMWNNQPGDYDGYNERFGGLPAFRRAIQTYTRMGALVTLYTDPIRCDDNSKIGRQYGRLWGVVKPDGKHVTSYDVWNMCHDVPEYRRWVADTMRRVMRETGAGGIRLDEYGHRGWACFSTLHRHSYAERGVSQWQKAIAETCRLVRAAMDEVAPGSVLTTEHPGYDYEMQFLEGCITYDLTVQATPLRPLECNLQRFYFPECKAYELDHQGADLESKRKFWNGVESFGRYYPPAMYAILSENEDAYQGRSCTPLVPTLARGVYANRFAAGSKVLYHVYNATGHTFEGPALRLALAPGEHVFELLRGEECPMERGAVRIYLPRDDVACLAKLPRRLWLSRVGGALRARVTPPLPGGRLVVCNREGQVLGSQDAPGPRIELARVPAGALFVKLLKGRTLVDAAAVPGSTP